MVSDIMPRGFDPLSKKLRRAVMMDLTNPGRRMRNLEVLQFATT